MKTQMKIINIKDYLTIYGQKNVLYDKIKDSYLRGDQILLFIDNDTPVSSSFLNSSIGVFLDNYGLQNFKDTVKFKGAPAQFKRISTYIKDYTKIYLADSI